MKKVGFLIWCFVLMVLFSPCAYGQGNIFGLTTFEKDDILIGTDKDKLGTIQKGSLPYAPPGAHYLTDRAESGLSAEVNLGGLTPNGLLKINVTEGIASLSIVGLGTLTDTYLCTYSTGSGFVCNTNPASFQTALTNPVTGTGTNHYWTYWTGTSTVAGKSITASKPVCSDASGDPVACAGTEGVWQPAGSYLTDGSIYPLLSGRSGGTIQYGSPDSGEDYQIYSNLSKDGKIKLGDDNYVKEDWFSLIFGGDNSLAANAFTNCSLVFGQSNTFGPDAALGKSLVLGMNNFIRASVRFDYSSLLGEYNELYGYLEYSNILGENSIIVSSRDGGTGSQIISIGSSQIVGRYYNFSVSGTTVTISGDITGYILAGTYAFTNLTGGTNETLFYAEKTISNIAYATGNTTFTIDSPLDDREAGKFLIPCGDGTYPVVAIGKSIEVYKENEYVFGGLGGSVRLGLPSTALDDTDLQNGEIHPYLFGNNLRFKIKDGSGNMQNNLEMIDFNVLGSESLNEIDFVTHAKWDVTGEFTDSTGAAVYTHSTNTGTLTQTSGNMAISGVGGSWYRYDFEVTSAATTAPDTAEITTDFCETAVSIASLLTSTGVKTVYLQAKASPGDFVISVVSSFSDHNFTIDNFSLKEVQGGDVIANGKLYGRQGLTLQSLKAVSGSYFLCIDTSGVISSSATACAGP